MLIIAGIGTGVGKTVAAAIITTLVEGDYWKVIECGGSDTETVRTLLSPPSRCLESGYTLQAPLSPHHAARLEDKELSIEVLTPPSTGRPLVIEGAGGILVPLSLQTTLLDYLSSFEARWIVVSNHYLGSINHTLLTLESLQRRNRDICALVFNGRENRDSEKAITELSGISRYVRLHPEESINSRIIKRYADEWKVQLGPHLLK